MRISVLGGCLGLVETGQAAVVALVQPPGLLNREVRLSDLLQDRGQRHLRALQDGRVCDVEREAVGLKSLAAGDCFFNTWPEIA